MLLLQILYYLICVLTVSSKSDVLYRIDVAAHVMFSRPIEHHVGVPYNVVLYLYRADMHNDSSAL